MPTWKHSVLALLKRAALPLGVDVIPRWRIPRLPQAEHLRQIFDHCHTTLVFDVGANEGQYHDFLRDEVGYRGRILSVEPLPDLAEKMRRRTVHDPLWEIECMALGAVAGQAEFQRARSTEFSSFLTARADAGALFDQLNTLDDTIRVEVDTLDSLYSRYVRPTDRVYLKLDTQGFDLEVLRGGAEALSKIDALQSEVSMRPIYEGMPSFDQAIKVIEQHGFAVSGIFPNNDGHFPVLIEMDCHFIRDPARATR